MASMLSKSRSAYRSASSVISSSSNRKDLTNTAFSSLKISSLVIPLPTDSLRLALDEIPQRGHRVKMRFIVFLVRINFYVEILLQGQTQLQRINGVETESFAKQGRIGFDIIDTHVFELQFINNHLLNFYGDISHLTSNPVRNSSVNSG